VTFSVNAPVPGRVARVADDLRPALSAFASVRGRQTLLVKRLTDDRGPDLDRLDGRVRRALSGTPPARARVTGIDAFRDPPRGPGPVVYLAVESPGLRRVHEALVAEFGAVEGLEGPDYVPHVTLARDGPTGAADRLVARAVDPVEWTVSELEVYDAVREVVARRISLPA
jgi:2'-5' RNA ligase